VGEGLVGGVAEVGEQGEGALEVLVPPQPAQRAAEVAVGVCAADRVVGAFGGGEGEGAG
jgi:hypothetical protein